MINLKLLTIIYLCKRIGIETLGELQRFLREENKGKNTIQTLADYYYEKLGGENWGIVR